MNLKGYEFEKLLASPPAAARLFLFHGPDAAQAAELADRLAAKLGGDRVDLDPRALKADPGRLADEAASVSMFGGRSLLRVSGADDGAAEAAQLLLNAPAAEHPAILVGGELKGTSALRKLAEKHALAHTVICYAPDARAFLGLARDAARARGLDADPAALALLAAACAPERGILAQELDKLALYLGATPEKPKRLDPEHVRAVGAGEGAADIDPLVDGLAARDPKAVAQALARLEADRANGITLIRAAARRFTQLAEARAAMDAGASAEDAVGGLRPPLFWKAKAGFLTALNRWRGAELADAQAALLAAERAIKSPASVGDGLAAQALVTLALPRR